MSPREQNKWAQAIVREPSKEESKGEGVGCSPEEKARQELRSFSHTVVQSFSRLVVQSFSRSVVQCAESSQRSRVGGWRCKREKEGKRQEERADIYRPGGGRLWEKFCKKQAGRTFRLYKARVLTRTFRDNSLGRNCADSVTT